MAFHVRDPETDGLVRKLARQRNVGLTEAVKQAAEEALKNKEKDIQLRREKLDAIRAEIAAWPKTGLKADKAFFDSLYED